MLGYHLFMLFGNIWFRTLYGMRVRGKKNIPAQGSCLIVANHAGKLWIDLGILAALWPKRKPIMVMYGLPRQGGKVPKTMAIGNKIFPTIVSGSRGQGGAVGATRKILRALNNGETVMMMASGEVSWHGRLNQARPAAPWTALRTGVPVLPVAIMGTYDIWPRWQANPKRTGKITIRIGEPFTLSDGPQRRVSEEKILEAGTRITNEIQALIDMGR